MLLAENDMYRLNGRWSYLGELDARQSQPCGGWRTPSTPSTMRSGVDISYLSFLHFAFLLFIVTMATAGDSFMTSQK
jgi:hypothetical protein